MAFYQYRNYKGSKKASRYSALLHNWPLAICGWLCGTAGLLFFGFLFIAVRNLPMLIGFLLCAASLWYSIIRKKLCERKIIQALERDCPEIFERNELLKLKNGTKEDIQDVVRSFKERVNGYL